MEYFGVGVGTGDAIVGTCELQHLDDGRIRLHQPVFPNTGGGVES